LLGESRGDRLEKLERERERESQQVERAWSSHILYLFVDSSQSLAETCPDSSVREIPAEVFGLHVAALCDSMPSNS
jgi:hypothetical protein